MIPVEECPKEESPQAEREGSSNEPFAYNAASGIECINLILDEAEGVIDNITDEKTKATLRKLNKNIGKNCDIISEDTKREDPDIV